MQKWIMALLAIALLNQSALYATEVGAAAAASANTAKDNQWQNWTFAATLLVTATAGILAVSLDKGAHAH